MGGWGWDGTQRSKQAKQSRAEQSRAEGELPLPGKRLRRWPCNVAFRCICSDWAWDWRCSPGLITGPWRSSPRHIYVRLRWYGMGEDVTTTFSSGSKMLYRALVDGEVRGREKKNKKKSIENW